MSPDFDLPLSPQDVDQIVAALEGSGHNALVLSTSRFVLRVARGAEGGWTQEWRHSEPLIEPTVDHTRGEPLSSATPTSAADEVEGAAVSAPLPGTFYHAPQPGAAPFVSVGDIIESTTIIGIIETMKVMNSVTSGVAGEVVAIVALDGQMVDQDATLVVVRQTS